MAFFERVEHTADLAIRVWGRDWRELFAHTAAALFTMMAEPPAETGISRTVLIESMDAEALLVDWLNELIYLHEVEGETYADFRIDDFSPTRLVAHIAGGPTVRKLKTIKAATYHDLAITETEQGLEAHIVFDV
jgi:SHS2 domain-containing protein